MLLKSSDMYFEYSKCRTFCEFLIYVYEWFLFSLPWKRSVIFSPLQIVLMVKNEPHVLFFFVFSPLYNTAVVLCSIPPTQCKFLLLYNYYYCWVDCLNKNADFIWKPIALNLLNFYAKKRMYRQSCHDQELVKALIYSGHFPKKSWFSRVHFNPVPILSSSTFCTRDVQVELSKVRVFPARGLEVIFDATWRAA